jgi:hypothetical protein
MGKSIPGVKYGARPVKEMGSKDEFSMQLKRAE